MDMRQMEESFLPTFWNVLHKYERYGLVLLLFFPMLLGDCLTWNATIAIWDPKLSDQIGTLIDRFCPEISAKEYILNITARKIVIRLVY